MIFIIVPFADLHPEENRAEELKKYLTHMRVRVPAIYSIPVYIFVVEQMSPNVFNRGQLLNIGALEAKNISFENDTIVTSDVDMLPNDTLIEEFDLHKKITTLSPCCRLMESKNCMGLKIFHMAAASRRFASSLFLSATGTRMTSGAGAARTTFLKKESRS